MHPADYHAFMHGVCTSTEDVIVFTRIPHERTMHIVWEKGEDAVVFFQNGDNWVGLSEETGNPYIYLSAVDHTDSGALQWKLRVKREEASGNLFASELRTPWIDVTDRVPGALLNSKVSMFEFRTFHTAHGEVACKWRVNKKYVYDDAQISAKTRNAVLDSMVEPLY